MRPEDFTTSPPKNFEDEDLMLPNPREQPRDVPTRLSYEIFRIDLLIEHQSWIIEQRTKPQTFEGGVPSSDFAGQAASAEAFVISHAHGSKAARKDRGTADLLPSRSHQRSGSTAPGSTKALPGTSVPPTVSSFILDTSYRLYNDAWSTWGCTTGSCGCIVRTSPEAAKTNTSRCRQSDAFTAPEWY